MPFENFPLVWKLAFPVFASIFSRNVHPFPHLTLKIPFLLSKSHVDNVSNLNLRISFPRYQNESAHFIVCGKFKNKYFNPEKLF